MMLLNIGANALPIASSYHCVRQPPPYYSHSVQAPSGKTPYIIHLFKAATFLLRQLLIFGMWVTTLLHCFLIIIT